MIYQQRESLYYGSPSGKITAILHKVKPDGSLEPGHALDTAALEYYFRTGDNGDKMQFLETKVLARSYDSIMWYEKSRLAPVYFETTEKHRQKLNRLSGKKVMWPPLLFQIKNNRLKCRALKSNRRPTLKSKIFIAPLTHITESDGDVCLPQGLHIDKQKSLDENIAMISERFYDGIFGHGTGSMQQINHPGGHDGFWIEYLKKRQHNRFPVELLKPTHQTLGDLLK